MGKIFLWIFIAFFFGYCCYVGIHVIKIRLNYSSIKGEAEMLLAPGSTTPFYEVPSRLLEKAQEQNVPLGEQDIRIFDDEWDGYRVLTFSYIDSLVILDFKTFYFKFSFFDTVYTSSK
jgi:hypothetical protein